MNFLENSKINVIVESNEQGYMVHLKDYPGSYTRGESENIALAKVSSEVKRYCKWAGWDIPIHTQPVVIKNVTQMLGLMMVIQKFLLILIKIK